MNPYSILDIHHARISTEKYFIMNLPIILILLVPFWHSNYLVKGNSPALLYSLKPAEEALIDFPSPPCLIACPASTQKELKFNEEVSIAKNSLFLRKFQVINESQENTRWNICENLFKPSLLYNSEDDLYEIGYELYYKEGELRLAHDKYEAYRPISINNEIINSTRASNDFSITYKDVNNNTKFNLTSGCETLIFHWISAFSVKISGNKKEIDFDYNTNINHGLDHLRTKCEDYQLEDDYLNLLYSEKTQEKCLKELKTPPNSTKKSFVQLYGYLEKTQVIPLWYFRPYSAKLASCTRTNFVPVWKTIADRQLNKVDLYLFAIQHEFSTQPYTIGYICFGTSGVLKLPKLTDSGQRLEEIHLTTDSALHQMTIPIPKIIYRIISIYVDWKGDYKAAIIIHNDPTSVLEEDRICPKESQVSGWDEIQNDNPAEGLTYVCPLTQQVYDKLAAHPGDIYDVDTPLQLDSFFNPRVRDFSGLTIHEDRRDQIDEIYEKVLKNVPQVLEKLKSK